MADPLEEVAEDEGARAQYHSGKRSNRGKLETASGMPIRWMSKLKGSWWRKRQPSSAAQEAQQGARGRGGRLGGSNNRLRVHRVVLA